LLQNSLQSLSIIDNTVPMQPIVEHNSTVNTLYLIYHSESLVKDRLNRMEIQ